LGKIDQVRKRDLSSEAQAESSRSHGVKRNRPASGKVGRQTAVRYEQDAEKKAPEAYLRQQVRAIFQQGHGENEFAA
jgi:hypothetical protein